MNFLGPAYGLHGAISCCRSSAPRLLPVTAGLLNYGAAAVYWLSTKAASVEIAIPGSPTISLECGRLARFADGAALCRCGDTALLVTAVSQRKPASGFVGFTPLTVDYRHKASAAGRIPSNFFRRELGPTDVEILTARMIDRSLRPLFPAGYGQETQVTCNLMAADGIGDPAILAINGASAALAVSDIPWHGPVAAVRLGLIDDDVIINPSRRQLAKSRLDLVLAGAGRRQIVMLEMGGNDVPVHEIQRALKIGCGHLESIKAGIAQLAADVGKPKRDVERYFIPAEEMVLLARGLLEADARKVLSDDSHDKISRDQALEQIRKDVAEKMVADFSPSESPEPSAVREAINAAIKRIFRDLVFETNHRCDGRSLDALRNISCSVDVHKTLHGSAIFQRGQSQVFGTVTLDSADAAFRSDPIALITGGVAEKNFMLHYEFPPYAVNEVAQDRRGRNRRELGHGALAERALKPVIPPNYPMTIRVTAEVLESNGSTSMASACAGSLALMDAGVPITAPVAGLAIGLLTRPAEIPGEYTDYRILTDLLGIEDYLGDMDFKIAGTPRGITALQMDLKIPGIPIQYITESLEAAISGKRRILDTMNECIAAPRSEGKSCGPKTEQLIVPVTKRSRFLGVGGYNLRRVQSQTGVHISAIDESTHAIFAPNQEALNEAKEMIEEILAESSEPTFEFGAIYAAQIVELRSNGVMVILHPAMSPVLLPNSQLDTRKVRHPSALGLEVGQSISVKYFGRDPATGQVRLSRRVLQSTVPIGDMRWTKKRDREESQQKENGENKTAASPWSN